jgi:hypothetical protein
VFLFLFRFFKVDLIYFAGSLLYIDFRRHGLLSLYSKFLPGAALFIVTLLDETRDIDCSGCFVCMYVYNTTSFFHSALAEYELSKLYIFHLLPNFTRLFEYRLRHDQIQRDKGYGNLGKSGVAMTPNFVFLHCPCCPLHSLATSLQRLSEDEEAISPLTRRLDLLRPNARIATAHRLLTTVPALLFLLL